MAAEAEEIDSENWLFESKLKECRSSIPNLISRRQFNDRRKSVSGLCEQIRSRIAHYINGGEDYFCIDSKPIEVCRVARGHFSGRKAMVLVCKLEKSMMRLVQIMHKVIELTDRFEKR